MLLANVRNLIGSEYWNLAYCICPSQVIMNVAKDLIHHASCHCHFPNSMPKIKNTRSIPMSLLFSLVVIVATKTASTDVATASTESKLPFDPVQRHLRDNSTDERENEERLIASLDTIKKSLRERGFPVDNVESFAKAFIGERKSYSFENVKKIQRLEHRDHPKLFHHDQLDLLRKEEDLNVAAYIVLLGTDLNEQTVVKTAQKLDHLIHDVNTPEGTKTVAKQIQEGQFIAWLPFARTDQQFKEFILRLDRYESRHCAWKKSVFHEYREFLDTSPHARVKRQTLHDLRTTSEKARTSGPTRGDTE
ncbi:hypothetical protein PsorP6_016559 [Peronosclerospora sorghi]|uniref:Uncharacterized protein n=1 Tax=Peronosclerospora sorghi TaxID=230839 RepID=A0ACC0VNX4_9STRA|nr:hypothetical protein PsorP6_016559 [Peronosclerospora sorghi]